MKSTHMLRLNVESLLQKKGCIKRVYVYKTVYNRALSKLGDPYNRSTELSKLGDP